MASFESGAMRRLWAMAPLGLALAGLPQTGHATDIIEEIWSGDFGGYPSITVMPGQGLSVVLPHGTLDGASREQIARVAKSFMDRWAPGVCSTVFDFQSPHQKMHIEVRVMNAVTQAAPGDMTPMGPGSQVYADIVFDYVPNRQVTCIVPGMVNS
jgi:hypothetical protein